MKKKIPKSKANIFAKPYFLILSFIIAVYFQVLTFDYTGFDDDFLIVNNINNLKNLENITQIFTGNSFLTDAVYGFYRPLQTLSFMIDANLSSNNLSIFHLTNLILHILTCFLLFKLFSKLNFDDTISTALTLIYAVSPLLNSSIAWLPARGDLLLTLFSLTSFIFFINYLNNKKTLNLILHLTFFSAALFSKETAVVIPIIFILYFVTFHSKTRFKDLAITFFFWFIIGSVWYYLRSISISEFPENQIFGIIPFLENIPAFAEYLAKFFFPVKLDLLPIYSTFNTIVGILILAIIIFLVIKFKPSRKILLFALLWYFLIVLPGTLYSRNYPNTSQFYQYLDHRAYLSIIGILILFGQIIQHNLTNNIRRKIILYSIIVSVIFSLISFFNLKSYKNPETFLKKAISQNQHSSVANFLLGNYLKNNLKYSDAIAAYSKAIEINPDYAEALNNRGILYAMQNQFKYSLKDLSKAIELNPHIPDGYFNRAMVYEALSEDDLALKDYQKALQQRPNDKEILLSMSNLYSQKQNFEQSISILKKLIAIDPNYYPAYYNLANIYLDLKKFNLAIDNYTKALKINPNYTNAYLNRANAFWNISKFQLACKDWQSAARLGNKNAAALFQKYCINGN